MSDPAGHDESTHNSGDEARRGGTTSSGASARAATIRSWLLWLSVPLVAGLLMIGGYRAGQSWALGNRQPVAATAPSGHDSAATDSHDHAASPNDHNVGAGADSYDDSSFRNADTSAGGHSGHDTAAGGGHGTNTAPASRPRALVLSVFAGVNLAILITAAILRRRNAARGNGKRSSRPRPAIRVPAT